MYLSSHILRKIGWKSGFGGEQRLGLSLCFIVSVEEILKTRSHLSARLHKLLSNNWIHDNADLWCSIYFRFHFEIGPSFLESAQTQTFACKRLQQYFISASLFSRPDLKHQVSFKTAVIVYLKNLEEFYISLKALHGLTFSSRWVDDDDNNLDWMIPQIKHIYAQMINVMFDTLISHGKDFPVISTEWRHSESTGVIFTPLRPFYKDLCRIKNHIFRIWWVFMCQGCQTSDHYQISSVNESESTGQCPHRLGCTLHKLMSSVAWQPQTIHTNKSYIWWNNVAI